MILVIDNKMDPPHGSADLVRYLSGSPIVVKRGPDNQVPQDLSGFTHIVISGSRTSCLSQEPWVDTLLGMIRKASDLSIPTLGVCFGHQMIARAFGGIQAVRKSKTPEFGWIPIVNHRAHRQDDGFFGRLPENFFSFASHYEEVAQLPPGFTITASNERCAIQGFRCDEKPFIGIQFHPERNATEGQLSIDRNKMTVSADAVFNDGKSHQCYNENLTLQMFRGFLEQKF